MGESPNCQRRYLFVFRKLGIPFALRERTAHSVPLSFMMSQTMRMKKSSVVFIQAVNKMKPYEQQSTQVHSLYISMPEPYLILADAGEGYAIENYIIETYISSDRDKREIITIGVMMVGSIICSIIISVVYKKRTTLKENK